MAPAPFRIRRVTPTDHALMHGLLGMFGEAFGDAAAIALYTKLGAREDVLHFDIAVRSRDSLV